MKHFAKKTAAFLMALALAVGCAAGVMAAGEIYITGYTGPTGGNTILEYKDGNLADIVKRANKNQVYLFVKDTRITDTAVGTAIEETYKVTPTIADDDKVTISARTTGKDFAASWEVVVDDTMPVKYDTTEQALTYTIRTNNLEWLGGGTMLDVDIFYSKGGLEVMSISQILSGFGTKNIITPAPEPTATPEPTPTPTPEPTLRTSGLIVRSTSIGGTTVEAGDDFTLTLEIYATASGTENLCDVLVAINPADGVTLASGSSTQYIGTMAPGASTNVSFPMHAQNSFTGGTSTVSVSLSASGERTGSSAQATGTNVTVPVIQPERFEISKLEVPNPITAGEENFCTITFVNKGKNAINNLTLTMTGSNLQENEQSEYVGNLPAGTEKSVDFNLCALEPGQLSGVIALEYEDSTGQQVLMTQNFGTNVEEAYVWDPWSDPGMMDDPMMDEPKPGLPWWAWAAIVIGVMGVGSGAFVFVKKRRAKAAAEALDEDF